jgi:hypothetical protein
MNLFQARRGRGLRAGLALVLALLLFPAAASAASNIEGVWSFNGGKVAVQTQADGSLVGTVVEPTKFSTCLHPAGEQMWTSMKLQPDGSYWGLHQWYFNDAACTPNPTLGKTAWRVLEQGNSRYLRVCFSEPGSESQPTIAPDGTTAGATFGCSDSALVANLPVVNQSTAEKYISTPPPATCLARPKLTVRVTQPEGDPFVKVVAGLTSGTVKRTAKLTRGKKAIRATFNLHGLTEPTFKVRITATTVLGHTITGKRSFMLCGPVRNHRVGTHH